MKKIDIIYIASLGRSGSTLLSMIMENLPGLTGVGELTSIWSDGFINNNLCTCGTTFKDCPVWSAVIEEAFGCHSKVDIWNIRQLKRSVERFRWIPGMISPSLHSPSIRVKFEEYTDIISRLYAAIYKTSGGTTIVDSSKIPTYGFMLNSIEKTNVHIVHLVRDSRAVAYSWQKKKIRPDVMTKQTYMPVYKPSTKALEWDFYNLLFEYLGKQVASYQLLRYEDLVSDPELAVTKILKLIFKDKVTVQPIPKTVFRDHVNESHMFGGNPVRYQDGPIEIKVDNEWLSRMSNNKRNLVTGITLPFLFRYGYGGSLF